MVEVKWAVIYFWLENDDLIPEVWGDGIETLQEAEEIRIENLKLELDVNPQNLQVIQYTDG